MTYLKIDRALHTVSASCEELHSIALWRLISQSVQMQVRSPYTILKLKLCCNKHKLKLTFCIDNEEFRHARAKSRYPINIVPYYCCYPYRSQISYRFPFEYSRLPFKTVLRDMECPSAHNAMLTELWCRALDCLSSNLIHIFFCK